MATLSQQEEKEGLKMSNSKINEDDGCQWNLGEYDASWSVVVQFCWSTVILANKKEFEACFFHDLG